MLVPRLFVADFIKVKGYRHTNGMVMKDSDPVSTKDDLMVKRFREAGAIILGTTAGAHRLVGDKTPATLKGKAFELVFGTDSKAMETVPERVLSVRSKHGPVLYFSARTKRDKRISPVSWRNPKAIASQGPKRRRSHR